MAEQDLSTTINDAAQKPAEARGDSASVRAHSLPDLIAADKYLAEKSAAQSRGLGLRFGRIIPPGTD